MTDMRVPAHITVNEAGRSADCSGVTSWYVIGTDDIQEAAALLRAVTSVDRWGGSFSGMFARRHGRWTSVDREPPLSVTKDASPGVLFAACRDGSAASDSSEESRK